MRTVWTKTPACRGFCFVASSLFIFCRKSIYLACTFGGAKRLFPALINHQSQNQNMRVKKTVGELELYAVSGTHTILLSIFPQLDSLVSHLNGLKQRVRNGYGFMARNFLNRLFPLKKRI